MQLNSKLAEYQDTTVGLERSLADRDARLAAAAKEKAALESKLAAFEQRTAALDDRLRNREQAHRQTETDLETRSSEAQRLKSDLGERARQRDEVLGQLASSQAAAAALEETLAQRDRKAEELQTELAETRREKEHLETAKGTFGARVAELEATLAERDAKIAALLEASSAAETALGNSEKRVGKLERLLADAGKEMAELQEAVAAEERRVVRLKQQLRDKQQALDLLERSAQRLEDLGASLEGFDRRFSAAPAAEVVSADLRPVEPSVEQAPANAGPQPALATRRRMIVALEGDEHTSYPLRGNDVTIGRSAESDIRLRSPFISRLHARILVRDADTLIQDLGSKNGILLNSAPITQSAALHDGDIISLGGLLNLKYVDRDEPAADASAVADRLPPLPVR